MNVHLIVRTASLAVFLGLTASLLAQPRSEQWAKVEDAVRAGKPQTAIDALDPLIASATADQAYAEAVKAIARKIALQSTIQGNKPEEKIVRLQAEMDQLPTEVRPVMEALLAHWYWHYFQQNRWRFLQRTTTATAPETAPGTDLQTWDLARILTEIDRHFTAALADEARLKATPIRDYDALLEAGTVSDVYRPTLYDFLAYEALQFYQAGEQAGRKAEEEFELDAAATPIFADAAEFMAWQPREVDEGSPTFRAVRLFQALLRFHRDDPVPAAFFDADLARLRFAHNRALGEDAADRYIAALERFIAATAKHEVSARARATLASLLVSRGEPARAHRIAQLGLKAFRDEPGGSLCFNVLQEIETKSVQVETERVWNAPWPTLDVTYRNVTELHFRAIPVNFHDYLRQSRWGYGGLTEPLRQSLLTDQPALAWSVRLPATTDYQQRTERLPSPASLKPGFYFILASPDEAFDGETAPVSFVNVWVSSLAVVTQLRSDGRAHGGFVLDARSGAPISGATLRLWRQDRDGWFKPDTAAKTDGNGHFPLPRKDENFVLVAEHRGQVVASSHAIYPAREREQEAADSRTVFFTDRGLYRPGQTIHYKGLSLEFDQAAGKYTTLADHRVEVVFSDPNGKEIARTTHRTNDYGSFSGTFTAPRDRVPGRMSLQALDTIGSTAIDVEEYKRPKFQVEIQSPAESIRLGTPVQLTGKATAYTGSPIGGAKVAWRVERSAQGPAWCWWWRPPVTKSVAHGTAFTADDGTFTMRFTPAPDRTVPEADEPVFSFSVHADVTDTTGETRSTDRAVRGGYTALQATLSADEWQTRGKPVRVTIGTSTLDSEPAVTTGTLSVYALKPPKTVERARLVKPVYLSSSRAIAPTVDSANPDTWELGQEVTRDSFTTDTKGTAEVALPLLAGLYRAMLETTDRFGRKVTARATVQVVDPSQRNLALKVPNLLTAPKWSVEQGDTFKALWGTGYDRGQAFVEIECAGETLQSYWTSQRRTQQTIEQEVTEEMLGGFTLRITYVRENRVYLNERLIYVPWSDKHLKVKWERFRSRLLPGQKETWTAIIEGHDAHRAAGEMVATLYDASLDQFRPFSFLAGFGVFREERPRVDTGFQNQSLPFQLFRGRWEWERRNVLWSYRSFPAALITNLRGWGFATDGEYTMADGMVVLSAFTVAGGRDGYGAAISAQASSRAAAPEKRTRPSTHVVDRAESLDSVMKESTDADRNSDNPPQRDNIKARRNLAETAFFLPQVRSDMSGRVKLEFTMPEALTEWKFMGFVHDEELRSGFVTARTVTAKDLMVEPNPPRFVREGDVVEFTVKVSNQSDQPQTGKVRLTFADAATLASVDAALGLQAPEQAFTIPARQSRSLAWRIAVPDGLGFLIYKAVGSSARASDGEEGFLSVLSRRILVTESLPLPVRGKTTKQFELPKLLAAGDSNTLRHQSLTVQMTSQPAWHAVMALPYLMEYPYECSEQVFNRLYANSLARHIVQSRPEIQQTFARWKGTPALDSPLEKNQELKAVMLEETPWLRQATSESEARRNVAVLFDAARIEAEMKRAVQILSERQLGDGLWPWFTGGQGDRYITLYLMTGFGRLRHLGAAVDTDPAIKTLHALDAWVSDRYVRLESRDSYVPSSIDALYLYGRSFFLADEPIAGAHREAVDFLCRQAKKFWLKNNSRQSQAHLALALQRFGDKQTAQAIVASFKERSVVDPELGMFWRDLELSWWWYHAPIETQALMIEAFSEIANDAQAVEDCKVWLLKQKQTQGWKTTKATADAVYALMLRGENPLGSSALVQVALAGEPIKPEKTEAGTGFYEHKFSAAEIKPAMGKVTVVKTDDGVSWGSVHWQYFEDVAKITPHADTPLKLKKTLFLKENTSRGPVLKPVTGTVSVGDELVVRLELRTDRDMEYLHLKDQRGSGVEPVNVLSRYKFQDGLAYYESTRDTASHFFISYLPKGVYVFEYSTRVQLKGRYQTGLAEIQCMYAPEFNSHSESLPLEVK